MVKIFLHRIAKGDMVYDSLRDMEGKNPYGIIKYVDRENNEVGVVFCGGKRIRYPDIAYVLTPQWFEGGGDLKDYLIEELEGNWSSHEGGDGEWKL